MASQPPALENAPLAFQTLHFHAHQSPPEPISSEPASGTAAKNGREKKGRGEPWRITNGTAAHITSPPVSPQTPELGKEAWGRRAARRDTPFSPCPTATRLSVPSPAASASPGLHCGAQPVPPHPYPCNAARRGAWPRRGTKRGRSVSASNEMQIQLTQEALEESTAYEGRGGHGLPAEQGMARKVPEALLLGQNRPHETSCSSFGMKSSWQSTP